MKYYRLKNKATNWGDYGDILLTGMTTHLDMLDGLLQLERTGPFQPNIIVSGINDIIVTESFKHKINQAQINGIDFKPVIKAHISLIDWTNWDLKADEPEFYPESGDPEGYILEQPHSEKTAQEMENVWELVIPINGVFNANSTFSIFNKSMDIMSLENRLWILVSERFKLWLEQNMADYLDFELVKVSEL